MKKLLAILAAVFTFSTNSLFALGAGDIAKPDTSKEDWKLAFQLYSRVVGSFGHGLTKSGKVGSSGSIRVRPGMTATNGSFFFKALLGVDLYTGQVSKDVKPGGGNSSGFGLGDYNSSTIQIRQLYMGYAWDNGAYLTGGIESAELPFVNADSAAGATVGWKNSMLDVNAFYFQIAQYNVYTRAQQSGIYGLKVNLNPVNELTITPFVAALWQGDRIFNGTNNTSYNGYAQGAKFNGNTGIYAGLEAMYTTAFGLYAKLDGIYAGGKNDLTVVKQTRNAAAVLLSVGYSLEQIMKAELFVDYRSGDKNGASGKTNHSINGALIEYDATTPPLYILYNFGSSRAAYQYGNGDSPDGYTYSDRGAITVGGDANFSLSMLNVGVSLGYAWYSASNSSQKSSIGFEADVNVGYNITNEFSTKVEAGILIPGEGLKNTATTKTSTPWLVNLVMQYSL